MAKHEIESILKRLRENEEITKKFQSVETKILSVLEFKDLPEGFHKVNLEHRIRQRVWCPPKFFTESLILAQNERWRRV